MRALAMALVSPPPTSQLLHALRVKIWQVLVWALVPALVAPAPSFQFLLPSHHQAFDIW